MIEFGACVVNKLNGNTSCFWKVNVTIMQISLSLVIGVL